jgi:hypothetical protein
MTMLPVTMLVNKTNIFLAGDRISDKFHAISSYSVPLGRKYQAESEVVFEESLVCRAREDVKSVKNLEWEIDTLLQAETFYRICLQEYIILPVEA